MDYCEVFAWCVQQAGKNLFSFLVSTHGAPDIHALLWNTDMNFQNIRIEVSLKRNADSQMELNHTKTGCFAACVIWLDPIFKPTMITADVNNCESVKRNLARAMYAFCYRQRLSWYALSRRA